MIKAKSSMLSEYFLIIISLYGLCLKEVYSAAINYNI